MCIRPSRVAAASRSGQPLARLGLQTTAQAAGRYGINAHGQWIRAGPTAGPAGGKPVLGPTAVAGLIAQPE